MTNHLLAYVKMSLADFERIKAVYRNPTPLVAADDPPLQWKSYADLAGARWRFQDAMAQILVVRKKKYAFILNVLINYLKNYRVNGHRLLLMWLQIVTRLYLLYDVATVRYNRMTKTDCAQYSNQFTLKM